MYAEVRWKVSDRMFVWKPTYTFPAPHRSILSWIFLVRKNGRLLPERFSRAEKCSTDDLMLVWFRPIGCTERER
jgi:hypothetical protein